MSSLNYSLQISHIKTFLHSLPYRPELSTELCTTIFHDGFVSFIHGFSATTSYDWLLKVKVKVTLRSTVSQSVSKSWCRAPCGAQDQLLLTVLQLRFCFLWGALSDERTGLFFAYTAGPCQRGPSRVRVPWYSGPYFTVSDLRLPFSSPSTTRRVTVEVFDPASTRNTHWLPVKSKSHCDW
jgi:hypothetical protein